MLRKYSYYLKGNTVKIENVYLNNRYGFLKEIQKKLLGINISKQQQSSYWGTDKLSEDQKEYAAKDVIYLHSLRAVLLEMLISENRNDIAHKLFEFLPTRVNLDLMGWNDIDIFSHGATK